MIKEGANKHFFVNDTALEQVTPEFRSIEDIFLLMRYLNLSDEDCVKYVCSLVTSLYDRVNSPIAFFVGPHSTGKTHMIRYWNDLVDPVKFMAQDITAISHQDLAINFGNSFMSSLDNVTKISPALSDLLCITSTGGKFGKRGHYENRKMIDHDVKCRLAISSIYDCVKRPDLASRILYFDTNGRVLETSANDEDFNLNYKEDKPYIFGAVLMLLSLALNIYPQLKKKWKSNNRMSGFEAMTISVALALDKKCKGDSDYVNVMKEGWRKNSIRQERIDSDEKALAVSLAHFLEDHGQNNYENFAKVFHSDWVSFLNSNAVWEGEEPAWISKLDRFKNSDQAFKVRLRDEGFKNELANLGWQIITERESRSNTSFIRIKKTLS